jgi:hypothetical protein
VSVGAYVSFRDVVAIVHATDASALDALQKAVVSSLQIKQRRDIAWDAIYGVEELHTIGWTSISSAKSNPTSTTSPCLRWQSAPDLAGRPGAASPGRYIAALPSRQHRTRGRAGIGTAQSRSRGRRWELTRRCGQHDLLVILSDRCFRSGIGKISRSVTTHGHRTRQPQELGHPTI